MRKFLLLSATALLIQSGISAADFTPRQMSGQKTISIATAKDNMTRIRHDRKNAVRKAISYDQPSGEWTEWKEIGTGTLTLSNMLDFTALLEEYEGVNEGIKVEQREDTANPAIGQFRFNGVFNDADIIVDYYANADGLLKIRKQSTNITDDLGSAINVLDFASCYEAMSPEDFYMTDEEFDEIIAEYNSYNYYIPTLGRFYIFLGFMIDGEDDACAMADAELQLDGFADFLPKFDDATFYSPDDKMSISLDPGVAYIRYGFFDGLVNQKKIDAVLNGAEGTYKITENSEIAIAEGKSNSLRNILAITFDADNAALEWGYKTFTVIDDEAGKWKSLGETDIVTDVFEGLLLGIEPTAYKAEIQENIATPGLYRLVNAFGEAYPVNEADEYDTEFNHYLIIDATDPDMVLIDMQHIGNDWGGGMFAMVSDAAYDISAGTDPASVKEMAGKLADGVITFPAKGLLVWCPDWEVFGGENGSIYISNQSGKTSISIPDNGGVDSVISDSDNAVTEYFNLQGIRIERPAKGQLVISRKGTAVSKTVIR